MEILKYSDHFKGYKRFYNFKYLEFLGYYVGNNSKLLTEEVESLEKLVEEIQLFIKIIECDDLVVKVSEIDGSLIIS